MFSTCLENFSAHFHHILNCLLQTLSVWKSLKFVVWERAKVLIFQPSIKEDLFFTGSNGTLPRPTPPPHPERFVFTLYAFELYNRLQNKLWFFLCLQYKSFENTMGKGEIARNEQFFLFPQCFLSFLSLSSNMKLLVVGNWGFWASDFTPF